MNKDTREIADLLTMLERSLVYDNKVETAAYIASIRNRIGSISGRDDVVAEIANMAPLAQYADFDNEQERLLGSIQDMASRLLNG